MNDIVTRLSEGIHYELIAPEKNLNDQAWDVRFLEGPHPETVIRYGNIAVDGDNDCLKFNFLIQYSPDESLTEEDLELQEYAADVLEDILVQAASDGSLVYGDQEKSED